MKSFLALNSFLFCYILTIVVLTERGKLTFGFGLGDVFPFFLMIFLLFLHFGLILYSVVKEKVQLSKWTAIIFFVIAVFVTYSITIGRGIENEWNGNIFISNLDEKKKRATTPTIKTGREVFAASSSRFAVFGFGRKVEGVKALFS